MAGNHDSSANGDKTSRPEDVYIAPESPAETRLGFKMAGIGFQVASEVAAGTLLGWLFDKWWGSAPTGVIVGSIIGILVGLWSLIRNALKLNRELEKAAPIRNRRTFPTAEEELEKDDWKDDWNDDGSAKLGKP